MSNGQMTEAQVVEAIGAQSVETNTAAMVTAAMAVIPPTEKVLVKGKWEPIKAQIEGAARRANLVTVKTVADRSTAETYARLLRPVLTKLENKRLDMTRTIREKMVNPINAAMGPVIKAGLDAVEHLHAQIRKYDKSLIEKRNAEQAAENAKAETRLKLQDAAVARGGERRQEIVPVAVPKPDIVQSDSSKYFRLTYQIVDESQVPRDVEIDGQTMQVCKPDPGCLRSITEALEAKFEKAEKGYKEVPQPVPGVKFEWKEHFRR